MEIKKIKTTIDDLIKEGEAVIINCPKGNGISGEYFCGEDYEKWINKCIIVLKKHYINEEVTKNFINASESAVGNGKKYYDTMIGVLKAISEIEDMGIVTSNTNEKKNKKIFVSHSSENRNITDKFVELLKIIGVKNNQIYYSSYEETGVEFLQNCLERISQEFNQNELLVIFMISREFYNSKVCIAETGATWVTDSDKYIPIIIPPYSYNNLEGVVSPTQAAIKLNDLNVSTKIEHLKSKIEEFIGIEKSADASEWTRAKDAFIANVVDITNNLNGIDAELIDFLVDETSPLVKIKLVNNTQHRMKLEEINISLNIDGEGSKELKLNNVIIKKLAIKPLEEITVYLPVDIQLDIKRSKIRLKDSCINLDFYPEV